MASLWENKASPDAYDTNLYPEVLRTFAKVYDATPKVQTFEAVTSTFHNVLAAVFLSRNSLGGEWVVGHSQSWTGGRG